jgi:hypothetical protein
MKVTITMKDGTVRQIEEKIGRIYYSKDFSGLLSLFEPGKDVALVNTDFNSVEIVDDVAAAKPSFAEKLKGKSE